MRRYPELTGNPLPGLAITVVLSVFLIFGINRCTSNKRSNVSESGYEWTTDSTYPCIIPLPKGFTIVQNPYTKKYVIYTGVGTPFTIFGDHVINYDDYTCPLYLGDIPESYDGEGTNSITNRVTIETAKQFADTCSAKNYYATYVHKIKRELRLADSVAKIDSIKHYNDSIALLFTPPKDSVLIQDTIGKIKLTPFDNGDIKKALKKEKRHKKNVHYGWAHDHILIDKDDNIWAWGRDDSTSQYVIGGLVDVSPARPQDEGPIYNWGRDKGGVLDFDTAYSLSRFLLIRPSHFIKLPEPMDTTLISMGFYHLEYYWFSPSQYDVEWNMKNFLLREHDSPLHIYFKGKEYTEATPTYERNPNFPDAYLVGIGMDSEGITTSN